MSDTKRSVLAAGGVVAAAGLVALGTFVRDRTDLGREPLQVSNSLRTLLASKDQRGEVPEGDYFYELARLLKREYVEDIDDNQKLATGAVRGMIASLGDPNSLYMDKESFRAFLNARQGKYEGIGAEFTLLLENPDTDTSLLNPTEEAAEAVAYPRSLPKLQVVAVTPGGPAAKAGVQPGDVVYSVDGRWVANSDEIAAFRKLQTDFQNKKIPIEKLNEARKDLRPKIEKALMALKAKERLTLGTSGNIQVVWTRNGEKRTTTLAKAASSMPESKLDGNTLTLRFSEGAAEELREAVEGKSELTIDLRNNPVGDYETMREALAVVAKPGQYGQIVTERTEKPMPFSIKDGASSPPRLTLLVDKTTRGPAEIFALALSSHSGAKLVGSLTGGNRTVQEIVALPDGSGYTLAVGKYRATVEDAVVAKKEVRS